MLEPSCGATWCDRYALLLDTNSAVDVTQFSISSSFSSHSPFNLLRFWQTISQSNMIHIFLDKNNTNWTHSNDHPLHQIRQRGKKSA